MINAFTMATKRALACTKDLTLSPLILAMSKEDVLRTLPGVYDPGDGNPYRLFPGPPTNHPLAARLCRAGFYWQTQPIDAVRALAKDGLRVTDSALVLWMRQESPLWPSMVRSITRLVRMLEQPESEEQVQAWWKTTREYLAQELERWERREARRLRKAGDKAREAGEAAGPR